MRSIIAWSLQLRLLAVVAAAVLIFFGVTELRHMPLDVVPEFSRPSVEVQTEARGLSAEEVEAMITVPLEADMLNGVSWVDEIRSESIPGLSSIVMYFEPGTELLVARQMVAERLVGVHALPNISTPPAMLQPVSSTSRFMKVGVSSESRSLIDLSVLARWTIVPRLRGVPGVANVSLWGQRRRQLQVQIDPETLRDNGITLQQIINTAGNALWVSPLSYLDASSPGTGGWIETPNQRLGVRHESPISEPADLAKVIIEGTATRLGDVTKVVEDHQPLIGDALIDDEPALMLVIEKFPWANTTEVTAGVEDALAALQLGLPGVELDSTLFRPATYLELAGANIWTALLIGAALGVVALLGLLYSWRAALVSTAAVTLSGLVAFAVLYVRGAPINMMVVAGVMVALGALIDDAVVDIQNIAARLRANRASGEDKSAARVIFDAAVEIRSPIIYATLIALLAVTPVFFLDGVLGIFSGTVVVSYALALLASMAVALTITPALSLLLLGSASEEGESPLAAALRRGFDGLLARSPQAASPAFGAIVGAVGVAVAIGLFAAVPSAESLLPQLRERDILIDIEGAAGTSEHAMSRVVGRASNELRSIAGVRNVSAHIGRAVMSDRVADVDQGEIWVSIDRTADYDATLKAIREMAMGYAGFDIDVNTYLTDQILDESTTDDALVVRVYGETNAEIRKKAEEVRQVLLKIDGIASAKLEHPADQPNLEIEVDLERSKAYGLTPGEVRRAATTLLSGLRVGDLFEHQKVFDVVVWGTPEIRQNLSDVGDLLIDTPPNWVATVSAQPRIGGHVRLAEVADVRIAPAPKVIQRESVARHVDVEAVVAGRALSAVAADAEAKIRSAVDFPLEYRAEVLGGAEQRAAARQRVIGLAVGAAIGILLLLQAAFGSWTLAATVFLALPAALLGSALTVLLGVPVSLGSVFGFLAVYGIAVRHALTLIKHYRECEKQTGGSLTPEQVRAATSDRLVPIVMTTVITALAFLPFVVMGTIAGIEILHPMAIVVLGGLVTATPMTLLVIPSLYLRYGADAEPDVILEEEPSRMIA